MYIPFLDNCFVHVMRDEWSSFCSRKKSKLYFNCEFLWISAPRQLRSIRGIPDKCNVHGEDALDGISMYGSSRICTFILAPLPSVLVITATIESSSRGYQNLCKLLHLNTWIYYYTYSIIIYILVAKLNCNIYIPSSDILSLNSNTALLFPNSFKMNFFSRPINRSIHNSRWLIVREGTSDSSSLQYSKVVALSCMSRGYASIVSIISFSSGI